VKRIDAIAHYAAPSLDDGLIILPETERASHVLSLEDYVAEREALR
jgi:formyltetrahydrofolate hydrolase